MLSCLLLTIGWIRPKVSEAGGLIRLFTPSTIPKKEDCDSCRVKPNKKKAVESNSLENLFKNLYRQNLNMFSSELPHETKRG